MDQKKKEQETSKNENEIKSIFLLSRKEFSSEKNISVEQMEKK